jgi:hypothetical protein
MHYSAGLIHQVLGVTMKFFLVGVGSMACLLLSGCSSGGAGCETFEAAYGDWDYVMHSVSVPGDAYTTVGTDTLRTGIDEAEAQSNGDVKVAIAKFSFQFEAELVVYVGTEYEADFRETVRGFGAPVVSACEAAGTPIELPRFESSK